MTERSNRVRNSWCTRKSGVKQCSFCRNSFKPIENRGQMKWCVRCVPDEQAFGRAARYNISHQTYEEFILTQGNACAICQKSFTGMSSKLIHVDHCHVTGKVRGVLCKNCNLGLGWFSNLSLLQGAVKYLSNTLNQ